MRSDNEPARAFARLAARALRQRWFVRAPIWLFRLRLGVVFGSRLLLLEHIGRTSGQRRYVALEIVARPTETSYVVASGFGARAQWYRNVLAAPSVRITLGSHRPRTARARILPPDEAGAALRAYASAHPRSWNALRPVFEATLGKATSELPLVEFVLD